MKDDLKLNEDCSSSSEETALPDETAAKIDEVGSKTDAAVNVNALNILLLGLVSFFSDMSTEMVYPIIPLILVELGTKPILIGVIEGVSESLSAFLKVFSGNIADRTKRKKPLAAVGYALSAVYKLGVLLSTAWTGIMVAKIADRAGKGIRTAPRDSLIAENGNGKLGKSFGFHKMFDMLGSALGVLAAFVILSLNYDNRAVVLWSVVPAVIGVAILLFVKEKKSQSVEKDKKFDLKSLPKQLWLYVLCVFFFSLGNSSNAFILLKTNEIGFTSTSILLVYLVYNVTASALAIAFGKLSDKIGRRKCIVMSYFLYGAVYVGFAFMSAAWQVWLLYALYGVYAALISGAEKALAVELSPENLKGTVLGLQGMAQGLGLFASSLLGGVLWQCFGSEFTFLFGAVMAFAAAVAMIFVLRNAKTSVAN